MPRAMLRNWECCCTSVSSSCLRWHGVYQILISVELCRYQCRNARLTVATKDPETTPYPPTVRLSTLEVGAVAIRRDLFGVIEAAGWNRCRYQSEIMRTS